MALQVLTDSIEIITEDFATKEEFDTHVNDSDIHVTTDDKTAWNAKADETDLTAHINDTSNPHSVTKTQVGLSNVTDDAQVKRSEMGVADGVATLDATGRVPSSQLPSYVDDVIEGYLDSGIFYETKAEDGTYSNEITGESGKIYIDLNENKTYRWSGTVFAIVSETLALGETSTTAYQGDKGKIAYDHSQITNGNPHGITKSTIGLDNVENKSSSTILSELTQNNVTTALGYVPAMSDLSNIDDTTFKSKVEASGFSSGTQVQILTWEETD